uniref:Uncharacterized protein n=1 Tax=Kalanchoe fedtschenkoi TaxID=63787 RepID=A0A7N0VCL8_KALFE
MSFGHAGKRVTWKGVHSSTSPTLHAINHNNELLDSLLTEFAVLFEEPQGLPPMRHIHHRIRLVAGTDAVAVRPYRYAHIQKDELERQCDDMLRRGVIRPST